MKPQHNGPGTEHHWNPERQRPRQVFRSWFVITIVFTVSMIVGYTVGKFTRQAPHSDHPPSIFVSKSQPYLDRQEKHL